MHFLLKTKKSILTYMYLEKTFENDKKDSFFEQIIIEWLYSQTIFEKEGRKIDNLWKIRIIHINRKNLTWVNKYSFQKLRKKAINDYGGSFVSWTINERLNPAIFFSLKYKAENIHWLKNNVRKWLKWFIRRMNRERIY